MLQLELNEVLEETADAAFCVDPQGEICFWNTSARDLLGYAASEAVGKNVHALLRCRGTLGTETCTSDFYGRQTAAENRKISNFDVQVKARSGDNMWLDLSTLILNSGQLIHVWLYISHAISPKGSKRISFIVCYNSRKRLSRCLTATGLRVSLRCRPCPNRNSASCASSPKARTLQRLPKALESVCRPSAITCTMPTRNLERATGWKLSPTRCIAT